MALGYEIGTIMKRTSTSYSDDKVTIKLDDIEGMDRTFVQVLTLLLLHLLPPLLIMACHLCSCRCWPGLAHDCKSTLRYLFKVCSMLFNRMEKYGTLQRYVMVASCPLVEW